MTEPQVNAAGSSTLWLPGQAEYSDDSLALKFTERYGGELRYTAAWGKWHRWNGHVWRADSTLAVFDLVREECRQHSAVCKDDRLTSRIASAQTISAVERLARADRHHAATVEHWDADPWLLSTPKGVVDLKTGMLRPARPGDYCTKLAAAAPGGTSPQWVAFLSRITDGDQGLQDYIQRMCGYALTGSTREHALFFLYGTGANGKSVFLNTIQGLMGDYATNAHVETFIDSKSQSHPTDLAGLQGARLVTASETEDGRHWAESKLKTLTGGDTISARFMRQDFFEFVPQFKLVIAGNHKPGLRTVDEAMCRRFNLLPFTYTIPVSERDLDLAEKLRDEWSGILQWMIDGCLAWQKQGLCPPKAVTEATAHYLAAQDNLARWMEDRIESDRGAWVSSAALFTDFSRWCEANGEYAGKQKSFSEALGARPDITSKATSSARGFLGLRLKTPQ